MNKIIHRFIAFVFLLCFLSNGAAKAQNNGFLPENTTLPDTNWRVEAVQTYYSTRPISVSFDIYPKNTRISIKEFYGEEFSDDDSIFLTEGVWNLIIQKEGYTPLEKTVTIVDKGQLSEVISEQLEPAFCMINFSCSPLDNQLRFKSVPTLCISGHYVDLLADKLFSFDSEDEIHYYNLYEGNIIPVPVGVHHIEVSADGFITSEKVLEAEPNIMRNVDFRLSAKSGTISIEDGGNAFYSEIFVDGVNFANIPIHSETITAGDHTITFEKDGLISVPERINVNVLENQDYSYTVKMVHYDSLFVNCQINNAEVYLDSELKGHTPLDLLKVPEGIHTVTVSAPGHFRERSVFFVDSVTSSRSFIPYLRPSASVYISTSADATKNVKLRIVEGDKILMDELPSPARIEIPKNSSYKVIAYETKDKMGLNSNLGRRSFTLRDNSKKLKISTLQKSHFVAASLSLTDYSNAPVRVSEANVFEYRQALGVDLLKLKILPGITVGALKSKIFTNIDDAYKGVPVSDDSNVYVFPENVLAVSPITNAELRLGGAFLHRVDLCLLGNYTYYPDLSDLIEKSHFNGYDYFLGGELSSRISSINFYVKIGYRVMDGYLKYGPAEKTSFIPSPSKIYCAGMGITVGVNLFGTKGENILRIF